MGIQYGSHAEEKWKNPHMSRFTTPQLRSHYPLPTIEEVATRLTNAKFFSVLDAKAGFWQVKLEEAASYLTTFNTLFGRFIDRDRCPLALAVPLKFGNNE